jgi:serine/threonine protein kinase
MTVHQAPDRRIGPYILRESLGKGGMGEVYRATDTRLGRDVAIKLLPAEFTGDAGRIARFMREARVLASLNHLFVGRALSGGTPPSLRTSVMPTARQP